MEVLAVCALMVAGVAAGALGAAGGITTLVSYPALLLVGVPPLLANVSNLVAGVACWPGSALTSRTEIAAVRGHLIRALVIAGAGGAGGATLLLRTSVDTFTIPLAAGLFVGSALGPIITRRVPATPIRLAVAALGMLFAVQLWLRG